MTKSCLCVSERNRRKERFLWKLRQSPLDVNFYNLMKRLQPNHKSFFQKGFLFSDNYIIAAHEGSFGCVTKAAWRVPLSCLLVINFVLLTLRKTVFLVKQFVKASQPPATHIFLQSQTQRPNLLVCRLQLMRDLQMCAPQCQQLWLNCETKINCGVLIGFLQLVRRSLTLFLLPQLSTLDRGQVCSPAQCFQPPKARCASSTNDFHCAVAGIINNVIRQNRSLKLKL